MYNSMLKASIYMHHPVSGRTEGNFGCVISKVLINFLVISLDFMTVSGYISNGVHDINALP